MFSKHLLYLSDTQLTAYLWRRGELAAEAAFTADAAGRTGFGKWLEEAPAAPLFLLADVIEEDFRAETMPHVFGKDRQALLQRKLGQHFRTAPYRQATFQGRESAGRRDDRVLLTALNNDEIIKPWVEIMAQHRAPLAAIQSVPLLTRMLVKKLGLSEPHQLVVTRQASTGLRQSYFQGEHLKFSRLTLLAGDGELAEAGTLSRESGRTQQYLNSLRLLPRDQALQIHVIAPEAEIPPLQAACPDTAQQRFQFLTLEDAAAAVGINTRGALCPDLLFLHLMGKSRLRQSYATADDSRYHRLRLTRLALLGASGALAAAGLAAAGLQLAGAYGLHQQRDQAEREAQAVLRRYEAIAANFPPAPAKAETMKAAVELTERISQRAAKPGPLLAMVSRALADLPEIRIDRIEWRVSDRPDAAPDEQAPGAPSMAPPGAQGADPKDQPVLSLQGGIYQIAVIEGEIAPFTGYRNALASVNRLIAALQSNPGVRVQPVTLPLDVSPKAVLQGKSDGADNPTADFSVKMTVSPAP
jgi:hypothetical protein